MNYLYLPKITFINLYEEIPYEQQKEKYDLLYDIKDKAKPVINEQIDFLIESLKGIIKKCYEDIVKEIVI